MRPVLLREEMLAHAISRATGSVVVSYDELDATAERDRAITGLDECAGRSVVVTDLRRTLPGLDA